MLSKLFVVIISQYIQIPNHYVVHQTNLILHLNLKKKKEEVVPWVHKMSCHGDIQSIKKK